MEFVYVLCRIKNATLLNQVETYPRTWYKTKLINYIQKLKIENDYDTLLIGVAIDFSRRTVRHQTTFFSQKTRNKTIYHIFRVAMGFAGWAVPARALS